MLLGAPSAMCRGYGKGVSRAAGRSPLDGYPAVWPEARAPLVGLAFCRLVIGDSLQLRVGVRRGQRSCPPKLTDAGGRGSDIAGLGVSESCRRRSAGRRLPTLAEIARRPERPSGQATDDRNGRRRQPERRAVPPCLGASHCLALSATWTEDGRSDHQETSLPVHQSRMTLGAGQTPRWAATGHPGHPAVWRVGVRRRELSASALAGPP